MRRNNIKKVNKLSEKKNGKKLSVEAEAKGMRVAKKMPFAA